MIPVMELLLPCGMIKLLRKAWVSLPTGAGHEGLVGVLRLASVCDSFLTALMCVGRFLCHVLFCERVHCILASALMFGCFTLALVGQLV